MIPQVSLASDVLPLHLQICGFYGLSTQTMKSPSEIARVSVFLSFFHHLHFQFLLFDFHISYILPTDKTHKNHLHIVCIKVAKRRSLYFSHFFNNCSKPYCLKLLRRQKHKELHTNCKKKKKVFIAF